MKNAIAFYCSPRKNGYSAQLVDQVAAGAESVGANIIRYDMNSTEIRGCQSCFWCRSHEGCATQDGLQPFYGQIAEAKGIIVGFPLYFSNISGQGKQWLDRMFPLLNADFSPRYPGKKCVAIYAQGNVDPNICKTAIDANNGFLKMFGWEITDSLLSYGNFQPNYQLPKELTDQAFEAGTKLLD